ncbi:MAG: hypothetical protein M4D80_18040 [Myxococcota bacterium]|nr:hypothetical protein [Myxococcota bacterium]
MEVDAPPLPGSAITVETDLAPSLIAYRDGAGGWKPAKVIDADTFELDVHGPYIVTVACDDGDGNITTWQVARTPDDDRELFLPCFAAFGATFDVTGTMVQAGAVTAGFSTDRSTTASWSFDVRVDPGTTDLFAFDANSIVSRRDLAVTADTAITPPLDVSQGTALVATPLVATNATAAETVSASISITTGNATFAPLFRGAAAQTKVAPTDFLRLTDRQSATVSARQGLASRAVRRARFRAGDPTDFTLPGPIGPVAYAQAGTNLEVTWSTLPEHDIVEITLDAFTEDFTTFFFHDVEISPAYIAATGTKTMTIDTDIPGYKPTWRIDYAKEYFRSAMARALRPSEIATSSINELVNAPPALTRSASRRSPATERALARRDAARER